MTEEKQNKNTYIEGESPTEEDLLWIKIVSTSIENSIQGLEKAAKELINITSFSQTIYFAAVSFSEAKKGISVFVRAQQYLVVIILVTPFIFWLLSLFCATKVFVPKIHHTILNSPDFARKTYQKVLQYKQEWLSRAHWMLILGFVPLLINIILYLLYYPVIKDKTG